MSTQYTVCLDPGHGPGTVNGSPDGTYKEREFTWDMYERIAPLLTAAGVKVICTRTEDKKPSLGERCRISNNAGADLFVSLHSNAAGGSGWSDPKGLMIYTHKAGDEASQNIAAQCILKRMQGENIQIFGSGLAHYGYTVLTNTYAPAVLIEYGFHTNQVDVENLKLYAYRDILAKATAKGILDFLGVAYQEEDKEEGVEAPSEWHRAAWEKAVKKGIFDGTSPQGAATREMMATVLDRLGLLG